MKTRVVAVVGPTAVGKSAVAVDVAELVDAEIISIDSMQIYRAMDVGTDKPSPDQRARVRHHLVDERPISHEMTVAEFQSLARTAIEEVVRGGRLPLLVGGSGLYWRAVVDDLVFPPRAAPVRAALEEEAATAGAEVLHARLRDADPTAAETIAPANVRRTIRALEVIEITGRPFSDYAHAWAQHSSRYDLRVAGLRRPREEMWRRIEARVDRMVADGLIDEARSLAASDMSKVARQALGYRQIVEARRDTPPHHIRDEIVRATKRFARRQESWFRSDPRIVWFDAAAPELSRDLETFFTG